MRHTISCMSKPNTNQFIMMISEEIRIVLIYGNSMNAKSLHPHRLLLLSAVMVLAVVLILSIEFNMDGEPISFTGTTAGESRSDDDTYRMDYEEDRPQPNGDHWSIWVWMEETDGNVWNKTTKDITVQVIRYVDSNEEVVVQQHGTGIGVLINLTYDLEEGNYTIRGKVDDAEMEWKKAIIRIPLTSRPPIAIAWLLHNEQHVKEATLILDRKGEADIVLDASMTWDPDEGDKEHIKYMWTDGDREIITNKASQQWNFSEDGDYYITLRAYDPNSTLGLYSEDWVIVHVQEILYQPDLKITIESDQQELEIGNPITITALVENIGNNNANEFDIYFYDNEGIFKFEHIVQIPYGSSDTIVLSYTPVKVGQLHIQTKVDPVDKIVEHNEDNNEDSFIIMVKAKELPNMVIEVFETNGSYEVSELTFITIIMHNTGKADAHIVQAYLYIDGVPVLNQTYDSVAAGERATIVYRWIPETEGFYSAHIEVWVDSDSPTHRYLNDIQILSSEKPKEDPDPTVPVLLVVSSGVLVVGLVAIGIYGVEDTKYRLLGSALVAPLYTRLKKEDTLNHKIRSRVYKHIVDHPGDSYASILHELELKNGTLVHHLRTLERERYVKSKKDGKFKRFYPWGTKVGDRDPNYLTDIQMEIVDIIKTSPGVSQASIANSLHKSRQSINYQIKVLAEAGLINVIKHGISTRCYVQET